MLTSKQVAPAIVIVFIVLLIVDASANRLVIGRITDLDGNPRAGLRVEAWHSDVGIKTL